MGWESRNSKPYYYRKMRRGLQVVSEYIGAGQIADLISDMYKLDHEERERNRRAWKEEKSEVRATDSEIAQLNVTLRGLVMATILVSGYHPHKGQLRKSRND